MRVIDTIMEEICRKGSKYDIIIDNIIAPNFHLKNELISELAMYWLVRPEAVEKVWAKNEFQYYFIMSVKNQIKSSDSAFHKNVRRTFGSEYNDEIGVYDDSNDNIEYKIDMEIKLKQIEDTIKKSKTITWFQSQMYREYYIEDKTYRQIEADYGIDHCLVFKSVKVVKDELKNKLR